MVYVFFFLIKEMTLVTRLFQVDTEEMPVDLLSLSVAQRYSILVTALNDSTANWAIHANMDTDMFDTVPDDLNPSEFYMVQSKCSTTHRCSQMRLPRSSILRLSR